MCVHYIFSAADLKTPTQRGKKYSFTRRWNPQNFPCSLSSVHIGCLSYSSLQVSSNPSGTSSHTHKRSPSLSLSHTLTISDSPARSNLDSCLGVLRISLPRPTSCLLPTVGTATSLPQCYQTRRLSFSRCSRPSCVTPPPCRQTRGGCAGARTDIARGTVAPHRSPVGSRAFLASPWRRDSLGALVGPLSTCQEAVRGTDEKMSQQKRNQANYGTEITHFIYQGSLSK